MIDFARDVLGIELFPWQRWLLVHALELLPDGSFRFRTVIVLVARQNGKSTLAQVLALFFMYVRAARLVIGTAQNLDIAEEVWQGAVDIAEDVPELAAEIEHVNKTNGKKALELVSGERYKVQAANRRGGRGLSGDLVILDELREHTSWDAWGAITKTTMARPLAQVWALSNAGDASSIVLRYLRRMAHAALGDPDGINRAEAVDDGDPLAGVEAPPDDDMVSDVSTGLFEWSAVPGCDLDDDTGQRQANPSRGWSITKRAIESARLTDPEWVFRTEVLCQWNDGTTEGPFPPGSWEAGRDTGSSIPGDGRVVYGVDVEHDRARTVIGVAGLRADGDAHVEVVAARAGTSWAVQWFRERAPVLDPVTGEWSGPLLRVLVQERGAPASSLLADLEAVPGLDVVPVGGSHLGESCGRFYDAVAAHLWRPDLEAGETEANRPVRVWHLPQPVLDLTAGTAVTKPVGDAWVWNRKASPYGAAPVCAVTWPLWDVLQPVEVGPGPSVYEEADLMVV